MIKHIKLLSVFATVAFNNGNNVNSSVVAIKKV